MEPRTPKPRFLTVAQLSEEHPGFSESSLRHLIHESASNGFYKVIRRIGSRKVLLDEHAFFEWVNAHKEEKPETNEEK